MTRTADTGGSRTGKHPPTRIERAIVLAGFAPAALCTLSGPFLDISGEVAAALWIGAALWAAFASAVLACRRGLCRSAVRAWRFPENDELIDWTTRTGEYAWMSVADEHERLMRGD